MDQGDEAGLVVGRLEFGGGLVDFRLEIVADRFGVALAPFGEVIVRFRRAGAHGGHIDRLGEAQWKFALGRLSPLLDDHLGGYVAPVDDDPVSQPPFILADFSATHWRAKLLILITMQK